MQLILKAIALGAALGLTMAACNARAAVSVGVGVQVNAVADFDGPLAVNGAWVEVSGRGRCWHPAHVEASWRPYCEGEWVWTDCGWYWQSDEPWAWACYHYGSWSYESGYGWVWIPGIEWSPAWVVWRSGGDHIGWAPCGPGGVVVVAPAAFVFVSTSHFHERIRSSTVIVNNTTIINETKVIGGVRHEDRDFGGRHERLAVNEGPKVEEIQKATGKSFKAQPVQEVDRRTRVPAAMKERRNEVRDAKPAVQDRSKTIADQPKDNPGDHKFVPGDRKDIPQDRPVPGERKDIPQEKPIPGEPKHTPENRKVPEVQPGSVPHENPAPPVERPVPPVERSAPPERHDEGERAPRGDGEGQRDRGDGGGDRGRDKDRH